VSGIRETKEFKPTRRDEDANGYLLAYRNIPDGYDGTPGWVRTRVQTMFRNINHYPYWIPMADLSLLPFHRGDVNAAGNSSEICAEDCTR
jgi:hypothetical protein